MNTAKENSRKEDAMRPESYAFLKSILETPSPSGYEQPVQKLVREWVRPFAEEVKTDLHGNVIAALNPAGSPRVMFAGHCDQIGLMVQHIDDDGFLYTQPIGGWDMQVLVGQNMTVWTKSGPVPGVIARKPIHLLTEDERKAQLKFTDLWVDIGAKDKAEALELVEIGDAVTFALGVRELRNNLIASPGVDDKVGTWVVMEALRLLSEQKFDAAVFAVSTVQEEIGLRGAHTSAFSIAPTVGIAVDVTHATDYPTIDKRQSGECSLGKGPAVYRGPNINPVVYDLLIEAAKSCEIPYQPKGASRPTGTDANAMQISRGGMATGLISIPNRYMHSPVEIVSLDDLNNAARLFAEFVLRVKKDTDFTP
jgi:endoglucanase